MSRCSRTNSRRTICARSMAPTKQSTSENDRRKAFSSETHRLEKSIDWRSAVHAYDVDIEGGGNDSLGSKINRRAQVEAELGISMGEEGWGWKTTSIAQRRVVIKEKFAFHVLVSPFEMWEIFDGLGSRRGHTS